MPHFKIIPIDNFLGTANESGTSAKTYVKGATYSVPESVAETFIENGLVRLHEDEVKRLENEQDDEQVTEEEEATADTGGRQANRRERKASSAKGQVPATWNA